MNTPCTRKLEMSPPPGVRVTNGRTDPVYVQAASRTSVNSLMPSRGRRTHPRTATADGTKTVPASAEITDPARVGHVTRADKDLKMTSSAGGVDRRALVGSDAESFVRSLYAEHSATLHGYVRRLVSDPHLGEDVVQETMPRAWRNSATLSPDRGSIGGWLRLREAPMVAALRRLGRNRTAVACAALLAALVVVAVCAPLLARLEGQTYSAVHTELVDALGYPTRGPGANHWFGVEPRLGRDLFARWAYGARPSLLIAVVATVAATTLGVSLGLLAGFAGGIVDSAISWLIDLLLSIPLILFVFAVVPVVGTWFGPDSGHGPASNSLIRLWTIACVFAVF